MVLTLFIEIQKCLIKGTKRLVLHGHQTHWRTTIQAILGHWSSNISFQRNSLIQDWQSSEAVIPHAIFIKKLKFFEGNMPLEPREAPSTCPNLSMFPPLTIPASECWTPLHPNISMHILQTVLYMFPELLTRRTCLTIKNCSSWWSFPLLLWP